MGKIRSLVWDRLSVGCLSDIQDRCHVGSQRCGLKERGMGWKYKFETREAILRAQRLDEITKERGREKKREPKFELQGLPEQEDRKKGN